MEGTEEKQQKGNFAYWAVPWRMKMKLMTGS